MGVLVAVGGFAVTFILAKTISGAIRKRRADRERAQAERQQSRQVRRAQERRNRR